VTSQFRERGVGAEIVAGRCRHCQTIGRLGGNIRESQIGALSGGIAAD
jgi:hypothetical protein